MTIPANGSAPSNDTGSAFELYRHLWEHAAGNRGAMLGSMAALVTAQCILLAVPYFAGHAINALQSLGVGGLREAAVWLALVVAATVASWLFHGPGRILERNVSIGVRRRVAGGLLGKLTALPLTWHEANHSAVTAHRLQQSSHALSGFAQSQFVYLNSVVRFVGPVLALWWLAPIVGVAAVVGFVTICIAVAGFDRAMIRLAREENDAERHYSSALLDCLGSSTTVFALRQARAMKRLLDERLDRVFAPMRRSIVLNEAKWCTVDIASRILSCGLVALFAWRATASAASAATQTLMLGSIYMVWEYASQASGVIAAFASHFQTFARQHADYQSADPIRAAVAPVEPAGTRHVEASARAWQSWHVRELSFRHRDARSDTPTLNHLALTLTRGKRYALIGASGCGKSTLLRVLAGLYEADRISVVQNPGPAIVAGSEAAHLFRATTTLVPQDAEVFAGTLAENLSACESLDGIPSRADYLAALRAAHVDDFVDLTRADVLDAPIAEHAANWSGGQRARIALARGILAARGSAVVLLDEPTASLDARTEARVYDDLFATFADACVISSIHRLHLLDRFDEVIVMNHGRVVAQGAPALLAATSPEFAQLLDASRCMDARTTSGSEAA